MKSLKDFTKKYDSVYVNDTFVLSDKTDERPIEFVQVGYQENNKAVIDAMEKKGYDIASIRDLFTYLDLHTGLIDEKKWIATIEGECCATFRRWRGERLVNVSRYDYGWLDCWWFAGLRKSVLTPSEPNSSSVPVSLDLSAALKTVIDSGEYVVYKKVNQSLITP